MIRVVNDLVFIYCVTKGLQVHSPEKFSCGNIINAIPIYIYIYMYVLERASFAQLLYLYLSTSHTASASSKVENQVAGLPLATLSVSTSIEWDKINGVFVNACFTILLLLFKLNTRPINIQIDATTTNIHHFHIHPIPYPSKYSLRRFVSSVGCAFDASLVQRRLFIGIATRWKKVFMTEMNKE